MSDDETDFELRRPDLLLTRVAKQLPFDRPRTLLASVAGRGRRQRLQAVTEVWQEPPLDDLEGPRFVESALERLGVERWARSPFRAWPLAVGVVVRPGAVWTGHDELDLLMGLRYGRNGFDVRQGEVLTVTPAGWMAWPDEAYGRTPRAAWARDALPLGVATSVT